jgi:hypothetical protein|tara:strand:+ start:983 stop:1123 length:141 start_codon:yes stop_codon:yes gene_type:complete
MNEDQQKILEAVEKYLGAIWPLDGSTKIEVYINRGVVEVTSSKKIR